MAGGADALADGGGGFAFAVAGVDVDAAVVCRHDSLGVLKPVGVIKTIVEAVEVFFRGDKAV